jgi:hypothetical protein
MTDMRRIAEMSYQSYQAAIQGAVAEFQQAKLAGDEQVMVDAANRIASFRSAQQQIPLMYQEAVNPAPAAPPVNKYGLTEAEAEVAKNFTHDPGLSVDDKMRTYAEQKTRYRHMRATGEYDDSQGRVFKR